MPKHPRLMRRGATYYHRAAIPKDIADTYPKREETFSLKTKDHREAMRLVRIAAADVDRRFDDHRRRIERLANPALDELTAEQLRHIHDCYYRHLLEEDEDIRQEGFAGYTAAKSFEDADDLNDWLTAATRHSYARGEQDTFMIDEAEDVLSWEGIELRLDPDSPSWPKLVRTLHEATLKAREAIKERFLGMIVPTPREEASHATAASSGPLLSELFRQRQAEAQRTNEWSTKLADDYETWTNLFIELIGNRPVLDYKKPDARRFKELLMELPSNRNKHELTKGLPALKAIEAAKLHDLSCISVSTINKALGRLQATWNWADKQLDEDVADIFGPMKLQKTTAARDERHPFSVDQLNSIFTSPLYTGCLSERQRAAPGTYNMRHTHWYWLPLLGLYTGARLNELCQLQLDDVLQEGGITFLRLHEGEDTQRIKGNSSRDVPLHRELISLGFLEYVKARQDAGDDRLFPALQPDAKGYYSNRPSKDFNVYIDKIGAKTTKTSFHSFRHNFKDACRNSGVNPDIADLLQGHSLKGMAGRYGSGKLLLTRLRDEMDKVEFPGVSLDHLCFERT
ncbi:DUF6538 domain-containing protein [Roseobacteraceae bacterium NS-SX3]